MGRRFSWAKLFASLLLMAGLSVNGLAQASAAELSSAPGMSAASPEAQATPETAQWRAVVREALPLEVSALEPEANEEPFAADASSFVESGAQRTINGTTRGKALRARAATCSMRLAASPVFARAPPRSAH